MWDVLADAFDQVQHTGERFSRPAFHLRTGWPAAPHAGAHGALEGQLGVGLSSFSRVFGELQRALHRVHEAVAVAMQRVHTAESSPEPQLLVTVVLEHQSAAEQSGRVDELVPRHRALCRAREPLDGFRPQRGQLGAAVRPCDVGILGTHRLRVVVGKQYGVLVPPGTEPFEPASELGVLPRAPRLRQPVVRDLARCAKEASRWPQGLCGWRDRE